MNPVSARGASRADLDAAVRLLREGDPQRAEQTLRRALRTNPGDAPARRLLGLVRARLGDAAEALTHLERAVRDAPHFEAASLDLARVLTSAGRQAEAEAVLAAFCRREPAAAAALQAWADALFANGKAEAARLAQRRAVEADAHFHDMRRAVQASAAGRLQDAEAIYRGILKSNPNHVHALVGLANAALDGNAPEDAQRLLNHALSVSAHASPVQRALARLHMHRGLHTEALAAARRAVELNPELADSWTTMGTVCATGLQQEAAQRAFVRSLRIAPNQPRVQLSLGHVRKALGERAASVRAYKEALALAPGLGEAWWSLADLKTYVFADDEVEAMRRALEDDALHERDRAAVYFALGKAFEDRGANDAAFEHYRRGNAIRARFEAFDVDRFQQQCARLQSVFTAARVSASRGRGTKPESPTPIFVVGLPRAGSTLIEQILASHSQVQGTMELPHILGYVREMDPRRGAPPPGYPACIEAMSPADFAALGERYIDETRAYHGDAPFFVDKMPNNFMHLGLIACMLPQAKFVDARRHPLGCCFSVYKQLFARGQAFGYHFDSLGAYYRGYLDVMAHWGRVMPGGVHRIIYERMVDDVEGQTRRLLRFCGLRFEAACLRFHETGRVVRTASAEQVRRPVYADAKTHWRAFEQHLAPLKKALGPALDAWAA